MPSKSRHQRDKNSFHSKKRKGRSSRPPILAQPPAAAEIPKPVSSLKVPVPSANAPTTIAKPTAAQYPYIATELRTIGILAGIILIILVVLALFLP